jgi:hypothetical protein
MILRTRVSTLPRIVACVALGALLLSAGCASKTKTVIGPKVPASEIAVYESTDLLHSQYTLVQHLWIDAWRSNWTFPRFNSEAEGLDAMKRAASDLGANALLHAICVDGARKPSQKSSLYCYGDAIRVN